MILKNKAIIEQDVRGLKQNRDVSIMIISAHTQNCRILRVVLLYNSL